MRIAHNAVALSTAIMMLALMIWFDDVSSFADYLEKLSFWKGHACLSYGDLTTYYGVKCGYVDPGDLMLFTLTLLCPVLLATLILSLSQKPEQPQAGEGHATRTPATTDPEDV